MGAAEGGMTQLSLFDSAKPAPERRPPNLPYIRKNLHAVLRLVRKAERMPWGPADAAYWQKFFPELTALLPEDERATLDAAFFHEIERLKAA